MTRQQLALTLAPVVIAGLLCGMLAGCQPKGSSGPTDPSRPYVGTWRMPTSGATWAFAADGTCVINGKQGTYTESNGTIQLSGAASYAVQWQVTDDGKKLTLTRPGKSFTAEFERQ
jgi:hypothetical protein